MRVEADAEDRRGRRVALTDAGRALLAAAVPVWRRVHAEVDAEVEAARRAASAARCGALSAGQGTSR